MEESERFARLETRMEALEKDSCDFKEKMYKYSEDARHAEINYATLTIKLSTLTDNLETHNEWHKENGQKGFTLTNTILAVGMLIIAIFQIYQASAIYQGVGKEKQRTAIVRNTTEVESGDPAKR